MAEEKGLELRSRKDRITRRQRTEESVLDLIWSSGVKW